jgi:hypothetical protein
MVHDPPVFRLSYVGIFLWLLSFVFSAMICFICIVPLCSILFRLLALCNIVAFEFRWWVLTICISWFSLLPANSINFITYNRQAFIIVLIIIIIIRSECRLLTTIQKWSSGRFLSISKLPPPPLHVRQLLIHVKHACIVNNLRGQHEMSNV